MSRFIPGGAICVKAPRVVEAIKMVVKKTKGLSLSTEYEQLPDGMVEFSATHFSRGLSDLINLLAVDGQLHFSINADDRWIEFNVPVSDDASAASLAKAARSFNYAGCVTGVRDGVFFVGMMVEPAPSLALYNGTSRDLYMLIALGLDLKL